jgi:hypothetical protein
MVRLSWAAFLMGALLLPACEPPLEEAPVGVTLRALEACDGGSSTSLQSVQRLRLVVQVPEGTDSLLTTAVDETFDLGGSTGFTLGGVPVGERRQITALAYDSGAEGARPAYFGRAKNVLVTKDQTSDVNVFLSPFGGYGCVKVAQDLTARAFPAIVTLDDGRLLIAGGFKTATSDAGTGTIALGSPSGEAFLFDPNQNSFAKINSTMITPRGAFNGVFLKSKRWVVLVGGATQVKVNPNTGDQFPFDLSVGSDALSSFEVLDLDATDGPAFLTSLKKPNGQAKAMNLKRVFPEVALMQDDTLHVYGGGPVPGGETGASGSGYDVVDVYAAGLDSDHGGDFMDPVPALEMLADRSGLTATLVEITADNLKRFLLWGGSKGQLLGEVYTATSQEKDGVHGAFKKLKVTGDVPPFTYFHQMTRLGNGSFLLTGGARWSSKMAAPSAEDAYVIELTDLDGVTEVIARSKRIAGLEVGRFMHASAGSDGLHAAVFGGFTDFKLTPTGDKRAFSWDGSNVTCGANATNCSPAAITAPVGEEDFAPMGGLQAASLASDAVFVYSGVADFTQDLTTQPRLQQAHIYVPGFLWGPEVVAQ